MLDLDTVLERTAAHVKEVFSGAYTEMEESVCMAKELY